MPLQFGTAALIVNDSVRQWHTDARKGKLGEKAARKKADQRVEAIKAARKNQYVKELARKLDDRFTIVYEAAEPTVFGVVPERLSIWLDLKPEYAEHSATPAEAQFEAAAMEDTLSQSLKPQPFYALSRLAPPTTRWLNALTEAFTWQENLKDFGVLPSPITKAQGIQIALRQLGLQAETPVDPT